MGKIRVLDKFTAEKIAAGEVVERPSSVIKELVENSIDAGATTITVEIKNGGTTYMRVTDNGSGMEPDDAKTAFLRHATSKIRTDKDLEKISTLGFRGEALCSIAAVSRTELFTKRAQSEGTHVLIEGGEILSSESAGCPDGTTIVVKNLFYNTPARMKFLKSDKTEGSYIMDVCQKQALSHPEVSIRFIRDGKDVLFTPGDNILKNAIHSIFGKDISSNVIEVNYEKDGVRVFGVAGKNNLSRPNRLMQIFFVNNRYISNKTLYNALSEAYKNELMVSRFPICFLNIELDPSNVDVNVHPTKTEVKFANESSVYESVYWGVKNSLMAASSPRDAFENSNASYKLPFEIKAPTQINFTVEKKSSFKPYTPQTIKTAPPIRTENQIREDVADFGTLPKKKIEGIETADTLKREFLPEPPKESTEEIYDFKILGQLFSTYVLIEKGDDFILLDQHAAHERIRYEEIKSRGDKAQTQILLMPINVNLTPLEKETASKNGDFLLDMGFEVEDFGGTSAILRSLPADCPYEEGGALFVELLSIFMGENGGDALKKRDKAIYTVACKGAIKANKNYSLSELEALYKKASSLEGISTCPHGRPISIKFSKYQIEKMFGRIV